MRLRNNFEVEIIVVTTKAIRKSILLLTSLSYFKKFCSRYQTRLSLTQGSQWFLENFPQVIKFLSGFWTYCQILGFFQASRFFGKPGNIIYKFLCRQNHIRRLAALPIFNKKKTVWVNKNCIKSPYVFSYPLFSP